MKNFVIYYIYFIIYICTWYYLCFTWLPLSKNQLMGVLRLYMQKNQYHAHKPHTTYIWALTRQKLNKIAYMSNGNTKQSWVQRQLSKQYKNSKFKNINKNCITIMARNIRSMKNLVCFARESPLTKLAKRNHVDVFSILESTTKTSIDCP